MRCSSLRRSSLRRSPLRRSPLRRSPLSLWLAFFFVWALAAGCGADSSSPEAPRSSTDDAGGSSADDAAGGGTPRPVEGCVGPADDALDAGPTDDASVEDPTAVGAAPPSFALRDVQPLSCGVGRTYGVEVFAGDVTLVTLLSARCPYCQSQIERLEQLRIELELAGTPVQMVAINRDVEAEWVERLVERASFAVLQDTSDVDAWGLYTGRKDDIFVYDRDLRLTAFFRTGEEPSLNLATDEGWRNVRDAVQAALDAP